MTPNDLARALLDLDVGLDPVAPDPRQLAREIIRRDRRRLRLLACLTVLLWLLAAAGLTVLVLSLHWYIRSVRIAEVTGWAAQKSQQQAPLANNTPAPPQQRQWLETDLLHHSIPYILGSIGALVLAAFCTVALILASRRTALRQVNAALLEISEQLKRLGRAEGP
jgi:hypothetical protein